MQQRRVVVTGFGGITALGHDWPTIERALRANVSGIVRMASVGSLPRAQHAPRRPGAGLRPSAAVQPQGVAHDGSRRACSRRARPRWRCRMRGSEDDPVVGSGAMGVAYGSCTGSTDAIREFGSMLTTGDVSGINATTYLRMMPHTAAANISVYFGIKGRADPGEQRLHLGQPEHRLRLRGHTLQPRDADGGGRRRGALRERSRGVRHAVRHQHAQ